MREIDPSPVKSTHQDYRRGLIIFGIVLVVLGVGGAVASIAAYGPLAGRPDLITRSAMGAAGLIWLGAGSILARRWARAILLCSGGICFINCIATIPSLLIVYFEATQPPGPSKFLSWLIPAGFSAALVAFYGQPGAQSTCDLRDPTGRWTDRCPLPVLACGCLLVYYAWGYLLDFGFGRPMPLAGISSGGSSARVLWLVLAACTFYAAWGVYRCNRQVWSLYLAVLILFNFLTFVALVRASQLTGLTPEVGSAIWNTAAGAFVGIGYLVYARFFFGKAEI